MVAPENLQQRCQQGHPHAPNKHAAGGGKCAAARDWAAGKAHRDCHHGPIEHRHANKGHESPPHSKTQATAALAAHPGAAPQSRRAVQPAAKYCLDRKTLKFSGKAAASFRGWVKPAHRTTADCAVALAPEALDNRGALQLELLPLLAGPTGVGQAKQLGQLRVEQGPGSTHAGQKTLKYGGMGAKGEMARSHCSMQRANPIHCWGVLLRKTVVATRIERDQQHRIRVERWCSHEGGSSSTSSNNLRMLSRQLRRTHSVSMLTSEAARHSSHVRRQSATTTAGVHQGQFRPKPQRISAIARSTHRIDLPDPSLTHRWSMTEAHCQQIQMTGISTNQGG